MTIETLSTCRITVLYDNRAHVEAYDSGWGFSCLIETEGRLLLFDTGESSEALLANMERAKVRPRQLDAVVLSHEHWDHIDGLERLLYVRPNLEVVLGKGFSEEFKQEVQIWGGRVREVGPDVTPLFPGIFSTGDMPSLNDRPSEQGVFFALSGGWMTVVGCSHPGIVAMLSRVRSLAERPIELLLGGFHLKDMSEEEIRGTADQLAELEIRRLAPTHCTGEAAEAILKERFPKEFIEVGAGWRGGFEHDSFSMD